MRIRHFRQLARKHDENFGKKREGWVARSVCNGMLTRNFSEQKKTVRFKLSCAQPPCVLHPLDAGYAKTSRWLAGFPDRSHVSIKHIAGIEKGQKNPSFEILQALTETLDLSLDNLIGKNLSAEEQDLNQLKTYYHSCPLEMRETLLNTIQAFTKELTALAEKMDKD